MTIKEFCKMWKPHTLIQVQYQDETITRFEAEYWKTVDRSVLGLEIAEIYGIKENGLQHQVMIRTKTDRPVYVKTRDQLQDMLNSDIFNDIALDADIGAPSEDTDECTTVCLGNGKQKTLNLNGHTIDGRSEYGDESCAAIEVNDGKLTIFGHGRVDGGSGSGENFAIYAVGDNAQVNLDGGLYDTGLDVDGEATPTIYGAENAMIQIRGGVFENSGAEETGDIRSVLDIQDGTGARILCSGGYFKSQRPSDGDDKDRETGATFLADGCVETMFLVGSSSFYKVTKKK